ncbi:hypothetical protein HDV00_010365 [Rhizophlyctis rosea]|nr:hypothetical protein HDV00_010365 [Rhizophlyctis rosea]
MHRPFLRHFLVALICIGTVIIGAGRYVSVVNGSWSESFVGLAVGLVVQIAVSYIVDVITTICEVHFALTLLKKGLPVDTAVAAWSTLYTASLRRIRDAKLNPITFFVITILVAELIVVGTIGELYKKEPLPSLKTIVSFPYISLPSSPDMDPTDAIDRTLGFNYGPLYMQGLIYAPSGSGACNAGRCVGTATGVLHSLLVSALTSDYALEGVDWQPFDRVTGAVTTVTATIECTARNDLLLTALPPPPSLMGATQTSFTMEDGTPVHADTTTYWGGIPEVYGENHPEIGVLMIIPDVPTNTNMFVPHYTDALGRLYILLYANRFPGAFDNMAQYDDPTTNSSIGISICSVDVMYGEGVAEIEVTGTDTALATKVISLTEKNVTLQRYDFSQPEHQPAAQVIINGYGYLNCASAFCPQAEGQIPYFDTFNNLLTQPPPNTAFPYQTGMSTAVQALARLGTSRLASLCTTSDGTQNAARVTAPYLISQFVTTTTCNAIILTGAACAVIFATIRIGARFKMSGMLGTLYRMMEMLHSVYGLMGVLDADEKLLEQSSNTTSVDKHKVPTQKGTVDFDATRWRNAFSERRVRIRRPNSTDKAMRSVVHFDDVDPLEQEVAPKPGKEEMNIRRSVVEERI